MPTSTEESGGLCDGKRPSLLPCNGAVSVPEGVRVSRTSASDKCDQV